MAITPKRLGEIQAVNNGAAGTVYAVPASTTAYVRSVTLHNVDTSTRSVQVWNVLDAAGAVGVAADTNQFINVDILAGDTVLVEFEAPGIIMEDENDSIQAQADAANKVTIQVSGFEEV